MKLFHGSTAEIIKPLVIESQRLLDFGKGFYTTTNPDQAEKWALIKQKRISTSANCIVSVYHFDDSLFGSGKFNIKKYDKANEEWLDFVVGNRRGLIEHNYDLVIGAVANDILYQTLSLYESSILTKSETISRLKTHLLFDQVSFHNANVLSYLSFINSYQVEICLTTNS